MLRALVPDVGKLADRLHTHQVTDKTVAKMYVREAMADPDPAALQKLYRDAYKKGSDLASGLVAKAAVGTVTAPLAELLQLAGAIWQQIAGWTSERIATVVTQQLAGDDHPDVRSVTQAINDVVNDKNRAHMIAQTECTRAMVTAAHATYKDAGVEQIEFLTADDDKVDDECTENEDQGPIPITDKFEHGMPPVHPRCRCTIIPAD
jgi:SPP1 gp7 family putative phage head morphogenesis protein